MLAERRQLSRERGSGLGQALLDLPLFLKVLVANVIVVLIGVGLGTWFTLNFVASPSSGEFHWAAVAVMLVVGFAGSVLLNAGGPSPALQPPHTLERTVGPVAPRDPSARAPRGP